MKHLRDMRIFKVPHLYSNHFITITRVWAHDGWCYIPELSKRERFLHVENDVFKVETEVWPGIVPPPKHTEVLKYSLLLESPLLWEESGPWGCERYEETTPNMQMFCHPQHSLGQVQLS